MTWDQFWDIIIFICQWLLIILIVLGAATIVIGTIVGIDRGFRELRKKK